MNQNCILNLFIHFSILISSNYSLVYRSHVRRNPFRMESLANWSPDSWTKLPVKQPPNYPDQVIMNMMI